MTDKFLTPKQKQVLDFILEYHREKGYAPSQQEIAKTFGFSSLGTVQHYLSQLTEQGYLQKSWNARRGLSVQAGTPGSSLGYPTGSAESPAGPSLLPLLGRVAAGRPIEAIEQSEKIEVPSSLLKKSGKHFVLEVRGDSMIEDGIFEGDFVIIRSQTSAENGETVVALISGEATIKRYYRMRSHIELRAANPNYPTIVVDDLKNFRIEGVLVGLIRKL